MSSILARRRVRAGPVPSKLGATKLDESSSPGSHAASAAPSPAQSIASSAGGTITPQDRSPLVTRASSAPAAGPSTTPPSLPYAAALPAGRRQGAPVSGGRSHQQLGHAHSAEAWLDSQLTPPSSSSRTLATGSASAGARGSTRELSHRSPSLGNVESAASQIVNKAMQYLAVSERGGTRATRSPKIDSNSLLDKGLDAITGVGKIMEGFALTLDSVIGQAFEEWSVGKSPAGAPAGRPTAPSPLGATQRAAVAAPPQQQHQASAAATAWHDSFDAPEAKENARPQRHASSTGGGEAGAGRPGSGRQTQVTSFMSKINAASEVEVQEWRRRAQQLAAELQRIKEQQEEYARIKDAYDRLQAEQAEAAAAKRAEPEEPEAPAQPAKAAAAAPAVPPIVDPCMADPLAAAQVTAQMEALLSEKARLAQENARLLRENTGLQELLEFTMVQQAQHYGDDELFDDYEGPYCDQLPVPLAGSGDATAAAAAVMDVPAAPAAAEVAASS